MSHSERSSQAKRSGGTVRDGAIVLLADPMAARRRQLLRGASGHRVVEAASLNEIYPTAEDLEPDLIVISAEFLREPELEGVVRLAEMLGSGLFLYAATDWSPVHTPLRDRLRCIPMRSGDVLADLLARHADPNSRLATTGSEPRLPDLVLLGASTGGIAAIETVLGSFPADCPPTLVVQHIREGFVPGLVQRLNQRLRPRVVEAAHDLPLLRGTVYFASDAERHLTVTGRPPGRCTLVAAPARHGHRPAVDPLFESALSWGGRVAAALLTGMGTDGAKGLGALRQAGAQTIAQDRGTSTVWGMPGAAVAAGAACEILPVDRIGPALLAGGLRIRDQPTEGGAA